MTREDDHEHVGIDRLGARSVLIHDPEEKPHGERATHHLPLLFRETIHERPARPTVIVTCEGGLVQSVTALGDVSDVDVLVLDFDVEGSDRCPACDGAKTIAAPDTHELDCEACDGTGVADAVQTSADGEPAFATLHLGDELEEPDNRARLSKVIGTLAARLSDREPRQ